ncbi:hypothetical protein GCM10023157_20630 [Gluconacetobacter asukensis]
MTMLHLHVVVLMCQAPQHLPVQPFLSRQRKGMGPADCRKTATIPEPAAQEQGRKTMVQCRKSQTALLSPAASIRIDYNHVSEIMAGTMKAPLFLSLYCVA